MILTSHFHHSFLERRKLVTESVLSLRSAHVFRKAQLLSISTEFALLNSMTFILGLKGCIWVAKEV